MKRYAAQYLFVAGQGYLKMMVAEVKDGNVVSLFSLKEEVENTEWLPGVLLLIPDGGGMQDVRDDEMEWQIGDGNMNRWGALYVNKPLATSTDILASHSRARLFSCPAFSFETMLPCVGIRHRRLL